MQPSLPTEKIMGGAGALVANHLSMWQVVQSYTLPVAGLSLTWPKVTNTDTLELLQFLTLVIIAERKYSKSNNISEERIEQDKNIKQLYLERRIDLINNQ